MLKTEAKGFYIDGGDDRLTVFGEGARKTHEMWQSTSQLPFLLTNSNNNTQAEPNTAMMIKKKPHIVIQKTNTSSTSSNTKKNLVPTFSKK